MNIKYSFFLLFLLGCAATKDKNLNNGFEKPFEGVVRYKMFTSKPDMFSEEEWKSKMKELTGEQGFVLYENHYKSGQFAANINSGLELGRQVYNPDDSLHYAWQLQSDTVLIEDFNKEGIINVKEIIELDTTATINNIQCQAIRVNLTLGEVLIWYNPELIYIEEDTYKGTLFGSAVINKIKTLPVKAELSGMIELEMLDFQTQQLDASTFEIPEFKVTQRMPTF